MRSLTIHPRLAIAACVVALSAEASLVARAPSASFTRAPNSLLPPSQEKLEEGPYNRLVIRSAMMIPGHGGPATGPVDIVIKKNVIKEIVSLDPVTMERRGDKGRPTGDRVIDATGMYVMPGLIDMHTHIRQNAMPLEYVYYLKLAHGVTTLVHAADRGWEGALTEAKKSAANQIIAPRLYPLYGWEKKGDPRWEDPAQAPALAREIVVQGGHVVSVGNLAWSPELFGAVCKAVYAAGGITTVHLPPSTNAVVDAGKAAELGVTMIEHHYGYAESALDRTVEDFPPGYNYGNEVDRFRWAGNVWRQTNVKRLMTEVVDRLVKSGVAMTSTMVVYEANRDIVRAMSLPWHDKYTHPALMRWNGPNPAFHGAYHYDWTSDDEAAWAYAYRTWLPFINEFKNRGGTVAYGTDDSYIWATAGFSNVRELQLLLEAGFHPLEAIKAATFTSAKVLREPRLGLIKEGYRADLAIVDGNPLYNVRFMYATGAYTLDPAGKMITKGGVRYTVKDGVVYDSPGLMREVERMVREAKTSAKTSE